MRERSADSPALRRTCKLVSRKAVRMCELLGVSVNRPERPTYAFLGFQHGSNSERREKPNPDGWGVGCYPNDGPKAFVLKEPKPVHLSQLADQLRQGELPKSSTHVLHIRRRSRSGGAEASINNTHPFTREVDGRDYVFAHNGYFKQEEAAAWNVEGFLPVGQTMSERAFCHITSTHIRLFQDRDWNALEAVFQRLNKSGDANCIMSDGEFMAIYRDSNGYANLSFVERQAPYKRKISLSDDEDYRVDLQLSQDESRQAILVATRPLTIGEGWKALPRGQLAVANSGSFVRMG